MGSADQQQDQRERLDRINNAFKQPPAKYFRDSCLWGHEGIAGPSGGSSGAGISTDGKRQAGPRHRRPSPDTAFSRHALGTRRSRHVRANVSRPCTARRRRRSAAGARGRNERPDPGSAAGNNPKVPAGFTYLGQFVDHDITLDLTAIGEKEADPTAVENFRTPALDLDSIYGLGPDGSRHLYARNPGDRRRQDSRSEAPGRQDHQCAGRRRDRRSPQRPAEKSRRLRPGRRSSQRRKPCRRADARRAAEIPQQGLRPAGCRGQAAGAIFTEARRIVTWHYQWMVLHDFVERVTEKGIVAKILERRPAVLPLQENAVHAGRVLRRRVPSRSQHGA